MAGFEDIIQTGLLQSAGDPAFLGLMLVGLFAGLVFVMNVRTDVKVMIMVPACIMACVVIPILLIPVLIIVAVVIMMAILKFMNR